MPVGWRDKIIRVLHKRSGSSTDRAHILVLLTNKEIDIRSLELEATASHAINGSMEARLGGKAAELGTLTPIHDKVYRKGKLTVVHWGLHLSSKGRDP